ncbi:hypothetical protein ANCCAN_22406 [Ancylostoma caninum]|uniref:Uncharacterized protein n=1 Tax=Ancylostoma caninum TaxID=29170 RepID=A0A368FI33_ANCCA|nr:hypothetical protein ANCCAN_22406 [Ancylostoma caninum]
MPAKKPEENEAAKPLRFDDDVVLKSEPSRKPIQNNLTVPMNQPVAPAEKQPSPIKQAPPAIKPSTPGEGNPKNQKAVPPRPIAGKTPKKSSKTTKTTKTQSSKSKSEKI